MSAVPAWKRLGLKLKGPSSDANPASTVAQPISSSAPAPASRFGNQQQHANSHLSNSNKRKDLPSRPYPSDNYKRQRTDDYAAGSTPSRKSVSFSQDTKQAAPKKPKKKKTPKPQTPPQPFDFGPMVEYLRTWDKARDSWKFNKNHQTLLIKHLYKSDAIPSSDIETFYKYISDIKGGSRARLLEQAEQIRSKDTTDGAKGFPEGTKAPEEKQKEYEEVLADLLAKMKKDAENKQESGETSPGSATGKRSFDEVELAMRPLDKAVQQRLIKRLRAESVIEQLRSSEDAEASGVGAALMTTTTTTTTTSSRVKVPLADGNANATNGKDGQKLKTKRRKKLRTADSSSSESDSDSSDSSDSDSDSSSSSDSGSDEEMATADGVGEDGGSSSSSSSSSESGSDSESDDSASNAAVDDAEDSGSEGDSESSDSDDEDDD